MTTSIQDQSEFISSLVDYERGGGLSGDERFKKWVDQNGRKIRKEGRTKVHNDNMVLMAYFRFGDDDNALENYINSNP